MVCQKEKVGQKEIGDILCNRYFGVLYSFESCRTKNNIRIGVVMNSEPESQIGFIAYAAIRTLRHPRILLQTNPIDVIGAELAFGRRKRNMVEFICSVTSNCKDYVYDILAEIDLPEDIKRYKARGCLFGIVRIMKPANVVETGCGGGYSSAYMLHAMKLNKHGNLYSVDSKEYFNAEYFNLPKGTPIGGMIPKHLYNGNWALLDGGSERDLRPLLDRIGIIDIFIHDSLHTEKNMKMEMETAWEHLKPGGVMLCHDIWKPWVDFAKKVKRDYVVYQHYGAIVK
jgi:hypothetical protein